MSAKNQPSSQLLQISPFSILRSLGKHLPLIGVVFALGAAATYFVVGLLPPVYSAEALVLVESQRIPENYVAATVNVNLEGRLNALRQQILSYSRLVEVIKKFDLYRAERATRPMEAVLELMRKDLSIGVQRGAVPGRPAAFTVAYRGSDPSTVAQVSNLIASFFIDENLRTREVEAVGTSEFLTAQLTEAKQRLEEQEQQLSAFKIRYSGELPQQENALIAAIGQARTHLTGIQDAMNRNQQNKLLAQTALETAEAEQAMMQQRTPVASTAGSSQTVTSVFNEAPVTAAPPRESERLALQLEGLRARYSETHPDVKRTMLALARAREAEARQPVAQAEPSPQTTRSATETAPSVPPPARPAEPARGAGERITTLRGQVAVWDLEMANLEKERQKLLRETAELQSRIDRLPLREQELARVTRDYENTRTNYQQMLDKKMAADVAANMERRQKAERFVMLEMARKPETPIKPKKMVLYGAGAAIALVAGLVVAVGIELKKGMLLGEWELPAGVVVLGRIPPIVTVHPAERRRWRPLVWATIPLCLALSLFVAAVYKGWITI
jgi:polysaccharide chain length determinant protein (PEP-CTERM system associated)